MYMQKEKGFGSFKNVRAFIEVIFYNKRVIETEKWTESTLA